jgi:hypothetical protein
MPEAAPKYLDPWLVLIYIEYIGIQLAHPFEIVIGRIRGSRYDDGVEV